MLWKQHMHWKWQLLDKELDKTLKFREYNVYLNMGEVYIHRNKTQGVIYKQDTNMIIM